MLSDIFKRAKSCKHGKHSIHRYTHVYNYILYLFYYVDICVATLENDCTINVQHKHMLEISQKSAYTYSQCEG